VHQVRPVHRRPGGRGDRKTEGNGGVNDFTRILSDQAFAAPSSRSAAAANRTSPKSDGVVGGCDGVITPHATCSHRTARPAGQQGRLVMGTAMSEPLLPEDIGRPAMVEKVAAAVKAR